MTNKMSKFINYAVFATFVLYWIWLMTSDAGMVAMPASLRDNSLIILIAYTLYLAMRPSAKQKSQAVLPK